MLGSAQDAEDAVQKSMLAAWRGLPGFEVRSSLRTWLYGVTTNVCLRLIARRPRRLLSPDHGPPRRDTDDFGEPVTGPVWLEPWPDGEPGEANPAARYLRRESMELGFVAALQHLPGTQRAVLILREVARVLRGPRSPPRWTPRRSFPMAWSSECCDVAGARASRVLRARWSAPFTEACVRQAGAHM